MPRITVPLIPSWQTDETEQLTGPLDPTEQKSWWFYIGSIILLAVAALVTLVGIGFCW